MAEQTEHTGDMWGILLSAFNVSSCLCSFYNGCYFTLALTDFHSEPYSIHRTKRGSLIQKFTTESWKRNEMCLSAECAPS